MKEAKFIDANGVRLFCEVFGGADDPLMLLVMGNSAPGLVWPDEFCELLARAGFRVVRFDQRDTGLSTFVDFDAAPYTLNDLVDDAFALMAGIGALRAHVVGLSQGGVIAYRMALAQPARVSSLAILMASHDLRPKNDAFADAAGRLGELPRPSPEYVLKVIALNAEPPKDEREVARRFVENFRLAKGPRSPFDEVAWQALGRAFAALPSLRDDRLTPTMANNSNHALAQKGTKALTNADLASIRMPVLLIHGSDDPIFPVEHARAAEKALPRANLQVIECMGHALDPAFYEPIVDALRDFQARTQ